jgi:hypothetical protein
MDLGAETDPTRLGGWRFCLWAKQGHATQATNNTTSQAGPGGFKYHVTLLIFVWEIWIRFSHQRSSTVHEIIINYTGLLTPG